MNWRPTQGVSVCPRILMLLFIFLSPSQIANASMHTHHCHVSTVIVFITHADKPRLPTTIKCSYKETRLESVRVCVSSAEIKIKKGDVLKKKENKKGNAAAVIGKSRRYTHLTQHITRPHPGMNKCVCVSAAACECLHANMCRGV